MAEIPNAIPHINRLLRSDTSGARSTSDGSTKLPPCALVEPIPISVFSNSRLLREALINLIKPHLAVYLVGSYTGEINPETDLPNPSRHVVLIDSGIGQQAASLWTRRWRADNAQVLLLELADNKEVILACIEMGANGYTLRESEPIEVAHAIYMVSMGMAACSPIVTAHLFARLASLKSEQSLRFSSHV